MRTLLLIVSLLSGYQLLIAQPQEIVGEDEAAFLRWFDEETGSASLAIYQGITYPLTLKARFGHQFFQERQWQTGKVLYENQWYVDVSMVFDLVEEQLVLKHPNSQFLHGIALDMPRVEAFTLAEATFRKLHLNEEARFFEVLFQGDQLRLLAWHIKEPDLRADGIHMNEKISYYLMWQEQMIALRSKKALKEVTPEAASMTRKIKSRDARLDFRNKERLAKFIEEFDALLD